MTNTKLFKSVLVLKGVSLDELADAVGMSRATLSYKINNKRLFNSEEIEKITRVLRLTIEEMNQIFFGNIVAERLQ